MKKKTAKRDCEEILCAGFGGQGIMFLGKLLAEAGLLAGRHVTWMPSYGAEVRGGTAYSMAKLSKTAIASPIVKYPDILIVMNKPSLQKYEGKVKPGGLILWNKSLIDTGPTRKDVRRVTIPMTDMAFKLGNARCANMIALGALLKRSRLASLRYGVTALKNALRGKEELFALNKKALEKGHRL